VLLEIAQIAIKPGMEGEFEAGARTAAPLFQRAKGCKSMSLNRSQEVPARYRLFVQWETLADHQTFVASADHDQWRKLVVHCFAGPPAVEHVTEVVRGF
jgi:heme-degrading monooxygenase HmoA